MPDFGSPVAQNVDINPGRGIQTISGLMGLKQQQQAIQSKAIGIQQQEQALQTGQYTQQAAQATAQQAQQTASQRAAIAQIDWLNYHGDDGLLSVDKMLSDKDLQKKAGDQFPDVLKAGAGIRQQQIENRQSLVNLNTGMRTQFGALMGALANDEDVLKDNPAGRQRVTDGINQWAQSAGVPEAAQVAKIYAPVAQHAPNGQLAPSLTNIQQQALGGKIEEKIETDPFGNKYITGYLPNGRIGYTRPVPGETTTGGGGTGGTGPMNVQAGDTPEAAANLRNEGESARVAMASAPDIHNNNKIIRDELNNVAATGQAGGIIAKAESWFGAGSVKGDSPSERAASAYDMIGKATMRNAAQFSKSVPGTNEGLQAAEKVMGSQTTNPTALRKISDLADTAATSAELYYPGLQKAVATAGKRGWFAKRDFDQQWAQNQGVPQAPLGAVQWFDALKRDDKSAMNDVLNPPNVKASDLQAYRAALKQKMLNLKKLTETGSIQ